ncbi:hypothetical protein AK812_SmicGene20044 [Symbiodinium microadriaticum]|uniref:Uncharacterized protein n=1 Tax=Symbiodinium microadriaticum TaxID=2951 RepID=A0A1Q9DQZ2_SYMMI|nr:hypothetical protein AK812_SmicGene20044 [Symbiodinium microadriaticum]
MVCGQDFACGQNARCSFSGGTGPQDAKGRWYFLMSAALAALVRKACQGAMTHWIVALVVSVSFGLAEVFGSASTEGGSLVPKKKQGQDVQAGQAVEVNDPATVPEDLPQMGTSLEIWEGQQSDGVLGAAQLVQPPVTLAELVPVLLLVLGPAEWYSDSWAWLFNTAGQESD